MRTKTMLTGGVLLALGASVCAAELSSDQAAPAPFAAKAEMSFALSWIISIVHLKRRLFR